MPARRSIAAHPMISSGVEMPYHIGDAACQWHNVLSPRYEKKCEELYDTVVVGRARAPTSAVACTEVSLKVNAAIKANPLVLRGGCKGGSGGGTSKGGSTGKGSGGGGTGGKSGAGKGQGGGNSPAGWPSTTGNPSGGGRSNNPPKSK